MPANRSLGMAFAFVYLVAASAAAGQCLEDPREVKLGKDFEGKEIAVRLKSYLCRAGEARGDPQIKVEFYRLAAEPTSLLIAKAPSDLLRTTLGSPRVVENDVFQTFADLIRQFGRTIEPSRTADDGAPQFSVGNVVALDRVRPRKIRALIVGGLVQIPAVREIDSLRKKMIPDDLRYFYSFSCGDKESDRASAGRCQDYDQDSVQMIFWRSVQKSDLADYAGNVAKYNKSLRQFSVELRRKDRSATPHGPIASNQLPDELKLLQYLTRNDWPENFAFLTGSYSPVGCGEGENVINGIDGWVFNYEMQQIFFETIVIENASRQPITIDALQGSVGVSTNLRPASSPPQQIMKLPLSFPQTLLPGERLLLPLRIVFDIPDSSLTWMSPYTETVRELGSKLGSNGFRASADSFRIPALQKFVYGPEYFIGGVTINGRDIRLAGNDENLIDLTLSSRAGSCPYLLSWTAVDGEWVDHGKVLHKGQGKNAEYSETRTFEGFRSRFRIVEREAEIAYIDQAELSVLLRKGEALTLKSRNPKLAARDGEYLRLLWGEEIELAFVLPEGVAEEDVIESRLTLTGYYERYSSLMAGTASKPRRAATSLSPDARICAVPAMSRPQSISFIERRGDQ